jgi:hypothetical protein
MNHSNTMHPFALRAALLSVLITSCMALLPSLAAVGGHQNAREAQNLQAATAAVQVSKAAI